MGDPPPPVPPAGWQDDPDDQSMWRYWNGAAWTDHRVSKSQPLPPEAPGQRRPPPRVRDPASLIVWIGWFVNNELGKPSREWGLMHWVVMATIVAVGSLLVMAIL